MGDWDTLLGHAVQGVADDSDVRTVAAEEPQRGDISIGTTGPGLATTLCPGPMFHTCLVSDNGVPNDASAVLGSISEGEAARRGDEGKA
mmetsp:Transcript_6515/g.10467  ORF Transcript_6515/g.10467 Transcript_6515/m.10467 type:complete len:89 (+) Transcript_6515:130-396(+)